MIGAGSNGRMPATGESRMQVRGAGKRRLRGTVDVDGGTGTYQVREVEELLVGVWP